MDCKVHTPLIIRCIDDGCSYDFYNTFTMWPQDVRKDLRAGIKARNQGDLTLSERYLTRYVTTLLQLKLYL